MSLRVIWFLAIVFTGLALVPSGARLFELPNMVDHRTSCSPKNRGECRYEC